LADGRLRLVATDDNDSPVGFVDLKTNGHLHYLYVDPDAGRSGIGTALLSAAMEAARTRGLDRVYAEASAAAVGCFLRQGFVRRARRDLSIAGVVIHNFSVELALRQGPCDG
jgi:ribosomal protein S18 acetylase RimI-like enzyme